MPVGYVTLISGDTHTTDNELSRPNPDSACTLIGVNKSEKPIESVLLEFSTDVKLTFAGSTGRFGGTNGTFRASRPLMPGERIEYLVLPAPGTLESAAVGWDPEARTHAVNARLAAGRSVVITYEANGEISTTAK